MKNILLVAALFLASCGGSGSQSQDEPVKVIEIIEEVEIIEDQPRSFVIAGQSNAQQCNWHLFESMTGDNRVGSIAIGGTSISTLIDVYEDIGPVDYIVFVHGERDAFLMTPTDQYVSDLEFYRSMIDAPIYISTVGYHADRPQEQSELLRMAVLDEAPKNPNWHIGFDNAHSFLDRDMLSDPVHFGADACTELEISMAVSVN